LASCEFLRNVVISNLSSHQFAGWMGDWNRFKEIGCGLSAGPIKSFAFEKISETIQGDELRRVRWHRLFKEEWYL
jgi:hypothetical protein